MPFPPTQSRCLSIVQDGEMVKTSDAIVFDVTSFSTIEKSTSFLREESPNLSLVLGI